MHYGFTALPTQDHIATTFLLRQARYPSLLAMDGLSGVASIIAVIDISAKVAALCLQYASAVKDASNDIQRLQKKVEDVRSILEALEQRLERPDGPRLLATSKLAKSLQGCQESLQYLNTELEPSKTRKTMSRFGARALKWPFRSKGVEKIVADLEKYEQAFSLSLQIDHT